MKCRNDCPAVELREDVVRTRLECDVRRAALNEAWEVHAERSRRRAEAIDVLALENAELRRQVEALTASKAELASMLAQSAPITGPSTIAPAAVATTTTSKPLQRTVKVQTSAGLLDTSHIKQQQADAIALKKATEEEALRVRREASEVSALLQLERSLHQQQLAHELTLVATMSAEAQRRTHLVTVESAEYWNTVRVFAMGIATLHKAWLEGVTHTTLRRQKTAFVMTNAMTCVLEDEATARSALVAEECQKRQSLAYGFSALLVAQSKATVSAAQQTLVRAEQRALASQRRCAEEDTRIAAAWSQIEAQQADMEAIRTLLTAESILATSPAPATPPPPSQTTALRVVDANAVYNRQKSLELAQARLEQLSRVFSRIERAAANVQASTSFTASEMNRSSSTSNADHGSTPPPAFAQPHVSFGNVSGYLQPSTRSGLDDSAHSRRSGGAEWTPERRAARGVPDRGRSATVGAPVTLHSPLSIRKPAPIETPTWSAGSHQYGVAPHRSSLRSIG